jgi:hypothetical protein
VKQFLLPVFETNAPTAPSIVTQPQSRTNTVGTSADFFVTAAGTAPLSYQWRFNGTNIAGANATNYIIGSVASSNAGNYSVIVTNNVGSATSEVAVLTVIVPPTNTPPAITTPPVSQTNAVGSTASFSVLATGTAPLAYQWRFASTNIPGATNSSFSKANVQTNDAGFYAVVVTNIAGAVTSAPALLTINPAQTNAPAGILAGWDVNGVTNFGPSPLVPTVVNTNVVVTGLTRGPGVTTTPLAAARAWGGNGFDAASAGLASAAGDYASFSIEVQPGHTVSFASLSRFEYRRSGTGPGNGVLQYQIAGGTFTDITSLSYPVSTSVGGSISLIDLSGIAPLQSVGAGTNVTFRIVNYGASDSGGTWYVFDTTNSPELDFIISGSVNSTNISGGPPAVASTLSPPLFTNGAIVFQLTGTAGSNYVVQASTNLSEWLNLHTNPAPFWFTNPINQPQRFYRGALAP